MSQEPLSIAHVIPHSWRSRHEVNDFAERVSVELAERGHRVLIATPSESRTAIRDSRRAIAAARQRPADLFGKVWEGVRAGGDGGPPVLAVGTGVPMPRGPRPRAAPVPVDASRTLEELLGGIELDVVHVHDPFAPSVSSLALRHSRSLNVATFHEPTERVLSTQVARPLVEIFFGRLDARTTSNRGTAELMERFFPGSYELVPPGVDSAGEGWWPKMPAVSRDPAARASEPSARITGRGGAAPEGRRGGEAPVGSLAEHVAGVDSGDQRPVRIAFCLEEERGALRLFLRALRRLPLELPWEATVWLPDRRELRLRRSLRERVQAVGPRQASPEQVVAAADVVCVASGGPRPAPSIVRRALASGTVPVATQIPVYEELTRDGELGLLFLPGDLLTLAGQLERLVSDGGLRDQVRKGASEATRDWAEVADQLEGIYRGICARRHAPNGRAELRRRLSRRRSIHIDLHMHTDHSPDCATPVRVLLETAKARGLGAIAITDHNEVSGALEARAIAEEIGGIKVIVSEEVKTAEQGEVIGLFIERKIPRGMTMQETIAEIRRQGGLVYVPHPFDRLHSVPDYEHLLDIVEEIDILEVFNPRVALTAFNEEAERFAAKYRIVPGAGSDSHVAQGLGSVMIRVHDFDGPEEFLEAMRDADIVRRRKNLIYVQALKFLQTSGGRGGAAMRDPSRGKR